MAVNLMVSGRIANVRMEETVRWVGPMLLAMGLVMVAVIIWPELALWLPRVLGYGFLSVFGRWRLRRKRHQLLFL